MTVEEVLRQSGMTDEQIKSLDSRAMGSFTTILTTATTAQTKAAADREEAEKKARAIQETLNTQINPALDAWAIEKATKDAEIAFYRTQSESAKAGGFIPRDAPGYTPPAQDPATGKFVAGTKGSPEFMSSTDAFRALSRVNGVQNEYFRLMGEPIPDDVETIAREAAESHLPYDVYAAKKYGFDAKRLEISTRKQKEHDDKIASDAVAAAQKEWAEKGGTNPNLRMAESSRYAAVSKAREAGQMKDPLTLSPDERRRQTSAAIHQDMATNSVQ